MLQNCSQVCEEASLGFFLHLFPFLIFRIIYIFPWDQTTPLSEKGSDGTNSAGPQNGHVSTPTNQKHGVRCSAVAVFQSRHDFSWCTGWRRRCSHLGVMKLGSGIWKYGARFSLSTNTSTPKTRATSTHWSPLLAQDSSTWFFCPSEFLCTLQMRNQGSQRSRNLPKVTQLISANAGI